MQFSEDDPLIQEDYSLKESEEWIAECQSLQPDLSLRLSSLGTAWDALCLIYLLSHIHNLYWITDDIFKKIAYKAYSNNYEGEWSTVQDFLETELRTPREFYEMFLKYRSPEEFFGNLQKRARRLIRIIRTYKRDPHGPVFRPQRKRGYGGKGTYVPPHRPKVEPPLRDQRLDRRRKVAHPLIYERELEE